MVLPGTPCATRLVTEVAIRQLKIKAVCKAFHANVGYDRRAIHSSGLLILNRNAKLPCLLAFCYVLCVAKEVALRLLSLSVRGIAGWPAAPEDGRTKGRLVAIPDKQ